jgi:biopolymer transport protein ExbD
MDIRNAIRQLALSGTEMYLTVCTVDAVDEKARTIDCTPIDEGAQLLGVNLQADQTQEVGVVVLTTEISKIMLKIGNTEATVEDNSVVLKTEKGSATLTADNLKFDIDGTTLEMKKDLSVWNGGSETTANATELQKQLNKCKTRIDQIVNAIKTGVVVAQDGGASYKSTMSAMLTAPEEDYSGIIDKKIKH